MEKFTINDNALCLEVKYEVKFPIYRFYPESSNQIFEKRSLLDTGMVLKESASTIGYEVGEVHPTNFDWNFYINKLPEANPIHFESLKNGILLRYPEKVVRYEPMLEGSTMSRVMISVLSNLGPLILAAPKQTQLTLAATKGNCFQTCIAAIMNKGIEDVPAFQEMDNAEWAAKFIEYVISQGWEYHGSVSLAFTGHEIWEEFPFLIVGGESPRGTKAGHAVIYFNGAPFWDPHPSGDFILSEKEAYLIRPKGGWGRS